MASDRPQQRPRSVGLSGSQPTLRSSVIAQQAKLNAAPHKRRSPRERFLFWGLVGGALFLVLLEVASKLSYDRAVSRLQSAYNDRTDEKPFTVQSALTLVNRPAKKISGDASTQLVYEWRWPSLFANYKVRVIGSTRDSADAYPRFGEADASESPPPAP